MENLYEPPRRAMRSNRLVMVAQFSNVRPPGGSIVRGSFYRCVVVKCCQEGFIKIVAVVLSRCVTAANPRKLPPSLTDVYHTLTKARRQILLREPLHLLHDGSHLSFLLGAVVLLDVLANLVTEVTVDSLVAGYHHAHGFF